VPARAETPPSLESPAFRRAAQALSRIDAVSSPGSPASRLAERVLTHIEAALDDARIEHLIDAPIDRTFESFELDPEHPAGDAPEHPFSVEHFHDAAARFVRHLTREGLPLGQELTDPESEAEAFRLLERYEGDAGVGYEAALLDALERGVDWVLASLAETLKAEARERHTRCILDRYLDPADWELLCAVTEILASRLQDYLPPDVARLPTAQLARSWQTLLVMWIDVRRIGGECRAWFG
jgi:hypothetical protein